MKKLLMAIPKGRILEDLKPLFAKINLIPESDFFDEKSRKLVFSTNNKNLDLLQVRSFDVATFVKFGAADIGICGLDVLEEFSSPEIFRLLDLKIGQCRLSIAGKKSLQFNLENKSHIRIATKYTQIAQNYFSNLGIQVEAIKLNGSIEIAAQLNLCDFILDLVSSGKTLEQNQMVELKKVIDVSSYLISNRASFKIFNEEINQLIKNFNVA
ncbi:MAG: ATP phosphoribosyltransferase [Rickettsiales bacterium]|nr:ATP phosphoribosyltransferase [Rickettsiales bacterium]